MGCGSSTVAPNKKLVQSNPGNHPPSVSNNEVPASPTGATGLVYQEAEDNSNNLFSAIKRGDILASKSLISQNVKDVNRMIGMWGSTPLIVAIQYGQQEVVDMLLSLDNLGDLNHCNEKGGSALLYACMEGVADTVRVILCYFGAKFD